MSETLPGGNPARGGRSTPTGPPHRRVRAQRVDALRACARWRGRSRRPGRDRAHVGPLGAGRRAMRLRPAVRRLPVLDRRRQARVRRLGPRRQRPRRGESATPWSAPAMCPAAHLQRLVSGWRAQRDHFAGELAAVLAAAQAESGARLLVDSSKMPAYAALMMRAEVDLTCVQVVRDPRGVANSLGKTVLRPEVTGADDLMHRTGVAESALWWSAFDVVTTVLRAVREVAVHHRSLRRLRRRPRRDGRAGTGLQRLVGHLR